MRFAKGHGTGNDFLILPDPDDAAVLPPDLVAGLCDRRTGLGADGILRAVRTSADGAAEWFMDYRNADGSIAEMCGNGVRVFARYLLRHGLAAGPDFTVATRAGLRRVREEPGGEITVDMGAPVAGARSAAVIGSRSYQGLEVSLGNPHLACLVDVPVGDIDLSAPPVVDHARFPEGANVEVVRVRGDGDLEMRVHERGSGVTLSCGTGAVAAAVAAQAAVTAGAGAQRARCDGFGPSHPDHSWAVQVPGGNLVVTLTEATSLLTGPAVIVAEGELDDAWLARCRGRAA
jgi:diaminopimelate epimerase